MTLSHLKWIALIGISLFFTVFGVLVLIASYELTNPFEFIMTLFAANFIILISVALCAGFVIKLTRLYRHDQPTPPVAPFLEDDASTKDN